MIGVTQFEMLVYNRWGELLFRSDDANRGWDGYYNGNLCVQDVYMYKITALYDNGQRIVRTGDINLIR
jgi:gliding motility-associated-like protein